MFLGKSKNVQKINTILLPDMGRALLRLHLIRKLRFPQLNANSLTFAVKSAKRRYVHGSKVMECACSDLGMTRTITAGIIRRTFTLKAVFEVNSKNQQP